LGERPNILLLVLDALRADQVEPYGAPLGASTTLAALAREGAAIPEVRSTATWTLPSHLAMFTGELARSLGLGQAPSETVQSAAPVVRAQRDRLLAEVLRQAGYETRGVTANGWLGTRSGFSTGFEHFTDLRTGRHGELGGPLAHRLRWAWEGMRARADDGAAEAQTILRQWIPELRRKPFFWFVNLVECHSPYLPPKRYAPLSPFTRALVADEAFRYLTYDGLFLACLGKRTVPAGAVKRMRRMYRGAVRYVDDWLARLLESLSHAGVLDKTLIVVCSDHGENFGTRGLMGHGISLDDRLLRVPFIVAGPGSTAFDGMRSLAELPSRIASAVQLEGHPWSDGLPAGLPVAQWDPFELTEERRERLVREWDLNEEDFEKLTSPLTCAVSGQLKLVRGASPEDESLYDLDVDPLELAPLRGQALEAYPDETLGALRAAVNHPLVQSTAAPGEPADPVTADEVADIEHRMRLMGYM
jgi:arylsulfatase A-like enzyme